MTSVRHKRRTQNHRFSPRAEALEDRKLLYSTSGGLWSYPIRVTYSFAPDGTNIGGVSSNLSARMANLGFSEQAWKDEFRKAAATWQVQANINLVEVSDNGAAFGVSGYQQGDSRFGDIRIGGISQPSGTMATAFAPPPFNGGTLASDIVISTNTTLTWKINNNYDLRTVAIHEFGHALGLDHSLVSAAVMHSNYSGLKQSLVTDDINGITSIYDTRQPDAYEPNNVYTAATNLDGLIDGKLQVSLSGLDIANAADADWFIVTVPNGTTGTMVVKMQSAGLSSLSPRVAVYNSAMAGLGQDIRANTYGDTATFTVSGVVPGQKYYIRASAAAAGITSAGAYAVQVNFGSFPQPPAPPPYTVVPEQPNQGGGSSNNLLDLLRGILSHRLDPPEMVSLGNLQGTGHTFESASRLVPSLPTRDLPTVPSILPTLSPLLEIFVVATDGPALLPTEITRRASRVLKLLDLAIADWDLRLDLDL
jgi:hypothetical protein